MPKKYKDPTETLKNVFVLVRCTKKSRKRYIDMLNVIFRSSKNILQAYTTTTEIKGELFCNAFKDIVHKKDLRSFETKLKNAKTKRHGIESIAMFVTN